MQVGLCGFVTSMIIIVCYYITVCDGMGKSQEPVGDDGWLGCCFFCLTLTKLTEVSFFVYQPNNFLLY